MNVCYATNSKYMNLMLVSIASLEKHNENCNIHILHNSLSDIEVKKINDRIFSNVQFYKIEETIVKKLETKMNYKDFHFTVETFFRILVPKTLQLEKVLYLDVDTMIRSNLTELYNLDLFNKPLAAVNWFEVSRKKLDSLEMVKKPVYFNAGVMLMNLKYLNQHVEIEKLLDSFEKTPQKYPLVDQDILNEAINGNHLILNKKYNYTNSTSKRIKFDKSVSIVHFAGKYKPYYCFVSHPFKKEFISYWKTINLNKKCIINKKIIWENFKNKFNLKKLIGSVDFLRKLKWKIMGEEGKWLRREH